MPRVTSECAGETERDRWGLTRGGGADCDQSRGAGGDTVAVNWAECRGFKRGQRRETGAIYAGHSWRGFTITGEKKCDVAAGGGNGRCFPMR